MMKRILVIEDQEDLRGILRDLLMGSGYAAAVAHHPRFSWREGVRQIESGLWVRFRAEGFMEATSAWGQRLSNR
jgi:CheY-like chemotaxis protein